MHVKNWPHSGRTKSISILCSAVLPVLKALIKPLAVPGYSDGMHVWCCACIWTNVLELVEAEIWPVDSCLYCCKIWLLTNLRRQQLGFILLFSVLSFMKFAWRFDKPYNTYGENYYSSLGYVDSLMERPDFQKYEQVRCQTWTHQNAGA